MSIRVKFFASLRERVGHSERELASDVASTVDEVWTQSTEGMEMPANLLIAINMDYVERGAAVTDGDEVAFFPPVTGG
ncbi:MAG: molybdopterin converting factor subunit 1 [Gammaproteobacteria bacterium]|nr:molybdopterin converting factor subunit 1 [Gammaproteobacteria bacterium]